MTCGWTTAQSLPCSKYGETLMLNPEGTQTRSTCGSHYNVAAEKGWIEAEWEDIATNLATTPELIKRATDILREKERIHRDHADGLRRKIHHATDHLAEVLAARTDSRPSSTPLDEDQGPCILTDADIAAGRDDDCTLHDHETHEARS